MNEWGPAELETFTDRLTQIWSLENAEELLTLRAEVERVYGERNDAVDELVLLRDERAAALAEVERIQNLIAGAEQRAQEAHAENERLRERDLEMLVEYDRQRKEGERLRINLRDYRQKHPCSHEVMCWADEIASKALARDKE